ncbi:hypothetical protein ACFLY6_02325 [Candidatus Dependentiae bacterium]
MIKFYESRYFFGKKGLDPRSKPGMTIERILKSHIGSSPYN